MEQVFWPYYEGQTPVFSKEDQCFYRENADGTVVRLNRQVELVPVAAIKTAVRPTFLSTLRAMIGV